MRKAALDPSRGRFESPSEWVMRISAHITGVAAVLALAGCTATAELPAQDPVAAIRAQVPADLRAAGTLKVGSDLAFEPMVYVENGKQVGFEVELIGALADRMGLKVEIIQTPWAELRERVVSGQLHATIATMTDTAKRQQEVNFVDYLNVGSSIVVRKGVTGVETLADLCGYRVAVLPDSIYQELAEGQSKRCPAGRPIRLVLDAKSDAAVLAGRADAYLHDYPIAVVAAKKNPGLEVVGDQIEAAPFGIAVAKNQDGLLKAIQAALFELFRDGTYDELLKKWGITEGSLKTGAINGGA